MSDYLTFWKVDTAVFLRSVGPREIFVPEALTSSLERLKLFCTTEPRTMVVITGPAGSGKSTLLRWLAHEIPVPTHEILILSMIHEEWQAGWLSPRLAEMLGTPQNSPDLDQSIWDVARRLDELVDEHKHILIAVDSAHLAQSPEALGEILAFLNIQALSVPCLTFILCGEPQLLATIGDIPGLLSKVALHVRLTPLSLDSTRTYIAHRLRLAGLVNPFDDQAVAWIHQHSQGILSMIDIHAEHCLIEAAQQGAHAITEAIARSAGDHFLVRVILDPTQEKTETALVNPDETSGESSLHHSPKTKHHAHKRSQTSPQRSTSPKASTKLPDHAATESPVANESPPPEWPQTPSAPPAPEASTAAPQPTPKPTEDKRDEDAGSASIRLSSLFKLKPGRPKP